MQNFDVPSLRELLDAGAEKFNNKPFIKYIKDGQIVEKSFSTVQKDSLAVCRMLRSKFAEKTHFAIIGKTSYDYLMFFSGVIISGNVGVPLSPEISASEAKELFERADIDGLFYDGDFAEKALELKKMLPYLKLVQKIDDGRAEEIYDLYSENSQYADLSDYAVDKKDSAVIIYTSGTTGVKKGVVLSSDALVGNIMYHDYCEDIFTEGAVSLSVLPMYHCYCFSGDYIKNLKDGVQLCLNSSLKEIVTNLTTFQPDVVRFVPLIAQSLLQQIRIVLRRNKNISPREAAEQVYGKNIKWIISGGAYLNPELVEEYRKLGIMMRQGYGMTEAGCRISVPDNDVSVASVGRVIDLCEVRIQNSEIQVKTPTVMTGYYKMPEETAKMFTSDGWLKTGDIGYVTEDNQLFITGRVKNLIILSGGENVSPEAIEKKFADIKLISEMLVYGENNRVVAEFYPDFEYAKANGIDDIEAYIENEVDKLNETAKASHIISKIKLRDIPFEKTGSGKIKRGTTIIGQE
ncbi:MAG: AMP-binding protein [Clostridia bacterium]|nr:AMP-binding protein [Clostridia bacterium]